MHFKISSAISSNLDQSKILSSGNGFRDIDFCMCANPFAKEDTLQKALFFCNKTFNFKHIKSVFADYQKEWMCKVSSH